MAENKNLGSQENRGQQGRSGQQSGNLGSQKGQKGQGVNRDLDMDEDLQQNVSTGRGQQGGRQSSLEDDSFDKGQKGNIGRSGSSGSNLGNR